MSTVFKNYEMGVIENAFLPLFIGSQPLNERSSLRSQFCKMRLFVVFLTTVTMVRWLVVSMFGWHLGLSCIQNWR